MLGVVNVLWFFCLIYGLIMTGCGNIGEGLIFIVVMTGILGGLEIGLRGGRS